MNQTQPSTGELPGLSDGYRITREGARVLWLAFARIGRIVNGKAKAPVRGAIAL
jgi:hypothetical protein